jgi:hypothetical protein
VLALALATLATAPGVAHTQDVLPDARVSWTALAAGAFFPSDEDAAGTIGYAVLDEAGGPPLWSAYMALGGPAQLGLPLSRPFWLPDARVYQVFERVVLRGAPGSETVEIADTLDLLWAVGREPWLSERGVPALDPAPADALTRLGWLTDDGLRDAYFSAQFPGTADGLPAALRRYGLPASVPAERDGALLQRFDKTLLSRDLTTGEIHSLDVGALLRESGLLTPDVLAPDHTVGGQLVPRARRSVLSWPNARGWGIPEPAPLSEPPPVGSAAPALASTPAPSPTLPPAADRATPTPSARAAAAHPGASLVVKAVVNQGRAEHVVIANEGTAAQELTGWSIRSGTGGQQIAFPAGFVLAPGAAVRVHSGTGASALHRPPIDLFGSGSNVWNNTGDQALLVDPTGRVVSQLSYAG